MENPLIRAAGGSLARAVEAIHAFLGLLVERWAAPEDATPLLVMGHEILAVWTGPGGPQIDVEITHALSDFWSKLDESKLSADRDLSFPRIWKRLLPASALEQDVKYYFMRSIRRRYRLAPSAAIARQLHAIAREVAPLAPHYAESSISYEKFVGIVKKAVEADQPKDAPAADPAAAYCDLCWALERVKPVGRGEITLEPEAADAEVLMSHLFGVPTGIPGFDELFGGGLMLADSTTRLLAALPDLQSEAAHQIGDQGIGGRVVLVTGPFGSGKSLLSLQMAVEVARKGGVAWVMALEQTDEECEYSMEAIGVSLQHPSMQVYSGLGALSLLTLPLASKGALVFLRPELRDKPNFGSFLTKVQTQLVWMSRYPLRLLVIDPVNALGREDDPGLRAQTRAMFEAAKHLNVNVWFTSEQLPGHAQEDRFEENVADTVIHLGRDDKYSPPRRYIEITKSRFQHEYSGRHALAIEAETGIHVYPPPSLISRSVRSGSPKKFAPAELRFGVSGMDQLFGPNPLLPGDLIVLAGPGKGKTLLGVQFLTADLDNSQVRNIFISDYDLQRIGRFVETAARRGGFDLGSHRSNLAQCSIQAAFPDPSRVLLHIRSQLDKCLEAGYAPGRALVTNLSRWEKEMPMLGDDVSFGIALGSLLRSYGFVSMLVSGDEIKHDSSRLQQTMASQSDTLIQFQRREFKGRLTTVLTTIKSFYMRHPRESFELLIEGNDLRIGPAPLFRTDSAGNVTPVKVVLYLHAETPNHKRYNEKILAALRTTLSPRTHIAPQSLRYDPQFLSLTQYSAVDELQVFQLDEFQLPRAGGMSEARVLQTFAADAHFKVLDGRLPSMVARVTCEESRRFFAVPFYQNISFLALHPKLYEREFPDKPAPRTWDDMVERCQDWESRHPLNEEQIAAAQAGWHSKDRTTNKESAPAPRPHAPDDPPEVFFSCPVYEESVETYNCFFMELLCAIQAPAENRQCNLAAWLRPGKNTIAAALQFRALCRRSHLVGFFREHRPRAIYWRHWYNTLNQELSAMPPEERSQVEVRTLFEGVTTAGDWYLAIPAHSASPEIGLDLIDNLTTSEREMQRLQLGVGLPTRESFYAKPQGGGDPPVSPYFRFSRPQLRTLVEKAFRRSRFHCYERFASTIAAHLLSILEIPDSGNVNDDVKGALTSMVSNIDFLRESTNCAGCNTTPRPPGLIVPENGSSQ